MKVNVLCRSCLQLGHLDKRKSDVLNLIKESIYAATCPNEVETFLTQRLGSVGISIYVTTESWEDNNIVIVIHMRDFPSYDCVLDIQARVEKTTLVKLAVKAVAVLLENKEKID